MARSNENKSCMRVEKREFAWELSQLSWPGQTRTRIAWELRSESSHQSFLNSHAPIKENKSCMRVDKSCEARVCIRVFSTLVARSNENKSCMRVDESWEARVCIRVFSTLMAQSNENKSSMRVDESWEERVCMRVFSTHVPRSKRTRVTWELIRVEKREFASEFSQLSWPG
jgi:hypothetical protein